jgi:hypothetical protein
MGQQLAQCYNCYASMKSLHVIADRVVEPQATLLLQLEDGRRSEGLGMRRHAKLVPRRQFLRGDEIG